jgi:sulfonate dioxygenase
MATTTTETTSSEPLALKLNQRPKNPDGSALYPDYLPFYDPLEKVDDIGLFDHFDPGQRADPTFPNLVGKASKVINLSPHVGTEIEGIQLSQLTQEGLDELALLAAQRGALVFRNQDFSEIGFEAQKKIVRHFGPLHIHGWAPHPAAGSAEHMIIYDHKEYVICKSPKAPLSLIHILTRPQRFAST